MNAEDLTVGTVLTSFDGEDGIIPLGTITKTERIELEKLMYNLTVDTAHTFFVGEQGWLVHNADPCDLPKLLGLGSTANLSKGTTLARNLNEQLAIEQAMTNPLAGNVLALKLNDLRWPSSSGWVKMQQIITPGSENINVHYVYQWSGKFKQP